MQTLVIKIGTSSLTGEGGGLALATIATLVEVLTGLRKSGYRVVLVSSGAVGVGCGRLALTERPKKIAMKQAVAAVGQGRLMRIYDDMFNSLDQPIAQILLTRNELKTRSCYVNAYNTFNALFELGAIPIVNENDTVAIEELKFGDNDTLSALVASLIDADWLFILTDVDRLYSADPRSFPDARAISTVSPEELANLSVDAGSTGGRWGTGGMATKLGAARIATRAGVRMCITKGNNPRNILKILDGEDIGTRFDPVPRTESARKRWIAYGLMSMGKLYLDRGAVAAIREGGKSLLAAGIVRVEGEFSASESVQLCTAEGKEIARGIVNYSSGEIDRIKGQHSDNIASLLGYKDTETVIHRDNLVLLVPLN